MGRKSVFQNPHLDGHTKEFAGGKRSGFLLIHGFTATTIEVTRLGRFFNSLDYPVFAPLLPGHGTTPEDLNSRKYNEWVQCVEQAYLEFSQKVDHVIVGGESMGAVLALYLAQHHPEIKALLLYSPALNVPNLTHARWLRLFFREIAKNDHGDESIWQGYTVWPLDAAVELIKLQRIVKCQLKKIKAAVAIFQGKFDKTIHPQVADFLFDQISSEIKKIFRMQDSAHVMLLGKEFDQISHTTMNFLQIHHIL